MLNKYIIDKNIVKIQVFHKGKEYEILVDIDDLDLVSSYSAWFLHWNNNRGHGCTRHLYVTAGEKYYDENGKKKRKTIYMHKIIMNSNWTEKREYVNHINHNTLDNRKENLEIVTQAVNSQLRCVPNSNGSTGVRNVNWGANRSEYWVQFSKEGNKFKKVFPLDKFEEAVEFAKQKRIELFGKE